MPTVYIETSIIGYLTARSSDAIIFLARQTLPGIYKVLRDSGYEPPLIVTPEEFSGNV